MTVAEWHLRRIHTLLRFDREQVRAKLSFLGEPAGLDGIEPPTLLVARRKAARGRSVSTTRPLEVRMHGERMCLLAPDASLKDASASGLETFALEVCKRWGIACTIQRMGYPAESAACIDAREARRRAEAFVAEHGPGLVVLPDRPGSYPFGWTFLYNTPRYARTRKRSDWEVGPGRILVDRFVGDVVSPGSAVGLLSTRVIDRYARDVATITPTKNSLLARIRSAIG